MAGCNQVQPLILLGDKSPSLSLELSQLAFGTAHMDVLLTVCVASISPTLHIIPGHSETGSGGSLPWEGREMQSCNF